MPQPERQGAPAPGLELALRIGVRLARDAIWHDRQCTWIGQFKERAGAAWRPVYRPLDGAFYNGSAGVACFLARLHVVTGDPLFREVALAALRHAVAFGEDWARAGRVGAYSGVGGLARACRLVGDQLRLDEWRELANRLMVLLAHAGRTALPHDWLDGHAGLVLLCLHWQERLPGVDLRREALDLAAPLLRVTLPEAGGLTHGAAGLAWALYEAGRVSGETMWLQSADRMHAQARRLAGREGGRSWCRGSAGQMLAAAGRSLGGDAMRPTGSQTGLRKLARSGTLLPAEDSLDLSLCHGEFGPVDVLWTLARRLRLTGVCSLALRENAALLDLAIQLEAGGKGMRAGPGDPTLLLGWAGIGDLQLRIHQGDSGSPLVL